MVRKILLYKIITVFILFISQNVFAKTINEVIGSNPAFEPAIIAISVKDVNSGKVIYQKNEKKLLHPASTLKMITAPAALDFLGKDYKFKTSIYKSEDNIYLKLGADPLFGHNDLVNLLSQYILKNNTPINNLIIDDSLIDKVSFGTGWQWDDNTSVYFPQISPYTINQNIFTLKVVCNGNNVDIEYPKEYKEKIINNLKCAEKTSISIERNIFSDKKEIILNGWIKTSKNISLPALNPESLFKNSLKYALLEKEIAFNSQFSYGKVPNTAILEASVEHSIEEVLKKILSDSNNFAAEILLKHAGAAKIGTTGTTKSGISVVKDFYQKYGVDTTGIIIADGSGASMNDYVSADFMTNALIAIKKNKNFNIIKNAMTTPIEGTFSGRNSELNGRIFVKTGTLANTSTLVGYLHTNSGKNIVFAIMSDNLPANVNPKGFENEIVKALANL